MKLKISIIIVGLIAFMNVYILHEKDSNKIALFQANALAQFPDEPETPEAPPKERYNEDHEDCTFKSTVDGNGDVTLFGIKKILGLKAGSTYEETYTDVTTECPIGTTHDSCTKYTCADFWKKK